MSRRLRLATRGSALALWQANWVAEQLCSHDPQIETELVIVRTTGDARTDVPLAALAGRGIFVREIEEAVLQGAADAAVHSAKDLPSADAPGLTLAAFCERADPRDVVISPRYGTLAALPTGAKVGTSAARRIAQLRAVRPDLEFVPIRGNVDTRLEKVQRGEVDALVLAGAGVARLGRSESVTEWLDPETCLPQVGQGCVAVQCRSDDPATIQIVHAACDHFVTRREVVCERMFLSLLGGGCTAPVAGYAISSDRFLYLFALVADLAGTTVLRTRAGAPLAHGDVVARGAYDDLVTRGAGALLAGESAHSTERE